MPDVTCVPWLGVLTVCSFTHQGVEHQRVERVAVRVLHHDVEESIQGVLQELE